MASVLRTFYRVWIMVGQFTGAVIWDARLSGHQKCVLQELQWTVHTPLMRGMGGDVSCSWE